MNSIKCDDLYVYIILSKMCNLRHTFCFQKDFSTIKLNDEVLYNLLTPIYERAKVLRIHGGEITIIPGAYEYIEFLAVKYPKVIINIVTNGVLFDDKWITLLKKYNNINVNISVNCTDEKITCSILKGDNGRFVHEKIFSNLKKILVVHNESERNVINAITMAVCQNTVDNIEDFALLAAECGVNAMFQFPCEENAVITNEILMGAVKAQRMKYLLKDYITIKILHSPLQTRCMELSDFYEDRWKSEKKNYIDGHINKLKKSKTMEILLYGDLGREIEEGFKCQMPWHGLFIDSLGFVYPCSNTPGYILGNVYYDNVLDILESERRIEIQEGVDNNCYKYCWERCNSNYYPNSSGGVVEGFQSPYQIAFDLQDYDKAIMYYQKIENLPVMTTKDLYQYAYCLHVTNQDIEKAIHIYSVVLEKEYNEFWVRYNRADAYIRIGEQKMAQEDIKIAYVLNPEHEGIQLLYNQYCS